MPWLQPDSIEWESQLERSCIYAAIGLWPVAKILHQPYRIPMPSENRERYYLPDFSVKLLDGSEIVVEVKPTCFIEKNRARFDAAAEWLRRSGIQFVVLTETQLRHHSWSHIAPMFLYYARWGIDDESRSEVIRCLQDAGGETSFRSLWDGINPMTKIPAFHMIGRREIFCDPRAWHGDDTRIFLTNPTLKNSNGEQNAYNEIAGSADLFFKWLGAEPWGSNHAVQEAD